MYYYDEIERDLSPEILNKIYKEIRRISKQFIDNYERLKPAIKFIKEELKKAGDCIVSIPDYFSTYSEPIVSFAIDTSFLTSPLSLVYGDFVVYIAGYIRFPRYLSSNSEVNRSIIVDVDLVTKQPVSSLIISAKSHVLERKLALKLLKNKREGIEGFDFDAIFIDGPILPLPLPPPRIEAVRELESVTEDMIYEAKELKVSLIGVVKRVRSKILARMFLKKNTEFKDLMDTANDKAITTLMLNRGECIKLGLLGKKEVIEAIAGNLINSSRLDSYLEEHSWLKKLHISFIKPKNSDQSVTVEILDYGNLGIDRILSWTNEQSSQSGCPHFLDAVDAFVKVEPRVVELARRILIRHAISELQDADIIKLLEHADLQKKFSPRMG